MPALFGECFYIFQVANEVMQCLMAKAFIAGRSNTDGVIGFVPLIKLSHEGENFGIESSAKKVGGENELRGGTEVVAKTEFVVVVVSDGQGSSPDTWGARFCKGSVGRDEFDRFGKE
jgi:hypothetical protein